MLFLSFCKIDARALRPYKSHAWLLTIQCGSFAAMCLLLHFLPNFRGSVLVEAALLCMICPTATSASVVTQKLGGDGADITMYTLLINVAVAFIVPSMIPLIEPQSNISFATALFRILSRVFPLLIFPLIAAQFCAFFPTKITSLFTFLPRFSFLSLGYSAQHSNICYLSKYCTYQSRVSRINRYSCCVIALLHYSV